MIDGSVWEIFLVILLVLVIIDFVIVRPRKKRRQEAIQERNEAIERKCREARERSEEKQRQKLIMLRNVHEEYAIKDYYEKYEKMYGAKWCEEQVKNEMLEYDKVSRKSWEKLGMTPPSFVRNTDRR